MPRSSPKNRVARARTRSLGALISNVLTYQGGPAGGGTSYSGSIAVGALSGNHKVTHDVVTPNYREAVRSGSRINNPYDSDVVTHTPYLANGYYRTSPTGWEVLSGPTVSWINGRIENNLPASGIETDNLSRIATLETWARVEPAKSQSLVTVLEAHKTWDTIIDRTRKLASVVNAARRLDARALKALLHDTPKRRLPPKVVIWDDDGRPLLDRRGKPRHFDAKRIVMTPTSKVNLDEASKLWLEYRYGWCPLVYDIVDTLKAVYAADLRNQLLPREILISRGGEKATSSKTTTATKVAGGLTYYTKVQADFEWSVRTYIHYRWKAPDGMLRRLNDFGLFDVPRAVWEVVPFSFVADWFVPIGDWLGALTPKIGVEYIDMGHTIRSKTVAYQEVTGVPAVNPPGAIPNNRWPPACPIESRDSYVQESVVRKTFLGTPYYPPIDVKLGIKRMADAAALFKRMR